MLGIIQSQSTWFSNLHDLIDALAVLAVGLTTLVGYKVHSLLFGMKLMERLSSLEGTAQDHEKRIDKVERKVFGV